MKMATITVKIDGESYEVHFYSVPVPVKVAKAVKTMIQAMNCGIGSAVVAVKEEEE